MPLRRRGAEKTSIGMVKLPTLSRKTGETRMGHLGENALLFADPQFAVANEA